MPFDAAGMPVVDASIGREAAVAVLFELAAASRELSAVLVDAAELVRRSLYIDACEIFQLIPGTNIPVLLAEAGDGDGLAGSPPAETARGFPYAATTLPPDMADGDGNREPDSEQHDVVKQDASGNVSVIIGGRRPFGFLRVHPVHPGALTEPDLQFIHTVANVLALTMERQANEDEATRLLEQEREARLQADEARHHFAFLAEASATLASSLDYETTLSSVAHLAVSQIADWCAVQIVEPDGSVRSLVTAHLDPARVELAKELNHRYPFDPEADSGTAQVLRTGISELVPDISDDMLAAVIEDDELLRIMRGLGLRSSMIVPLEARGRVIGAITFISAESGRHYNESDLQLAEALAGRAALAVDNARLHSASLRVAAEQAAILAHMADGVLMIDPCGQVVYANGAAYDLLGINKVLLAEEATLGVVKDLLQPASRDGRPVNINDLVLAQALHGEVLTNVERVVRRPDDTERVIQASAAPVVTADGRHIGAVAVFRDVTEHRQLERQRETFLSAAAHDLKTPLTTIKATAQVLERRIRRRPLPDAEPLLDGLQKIDATVTRMTRLVNDLLDVSRMQMGEPLELARDVLDVVGLVRRVASEIPHNRKRHHIVVETALVSLPATFDSDRLERVISNLLSNAVKYSPEGGTITVTIERDETPNGRTAIIVVRDEGIGIPAADLPRIFERFYRAQNVEGRIPGTGIGLLGTKQIVEHHGGTITIQSVEGEGTAVTIRLPLVDAAPAT